MTTYRRCKIILELIVCVLFGVGCVARIRAVDEAGGVTLVRDGAPASVIVLPRHPDRWEQLAADELTTYLARISGAIVPIVKAGEPLPIAGATRILIGAAATQAMDDLRIEGALGERVDEMSCRDGFVLRVGDDYVALAGVRPTGTLFAAYELLEQLGCRWFWPGQLGQVVPSSKTVALDAMELVQTPSFDLRTFWFSGDHSVDPFTQPWQRRMRSSLDYDLGFGHADNPPLSDPDGAKKKADELLAHLAEHPQQKWFSLCWGDSYADVNEQQGMGLRHPWNPEQFVATDALISYYNDVAQRVTTTHPNARFGIYGYMNYILAPGAHKVHPALAPLIAPIEQCPRHAPYSGECWQRDMLFDAVKQWCRLSNKVFFRDYEPGFLVDGGVPIPCVTRVRKEVPMLRDFGLRGFLHQSQCTLMNQGPNLYIMAKLMWDADADVDALLDDYYAKLFGPAAQPVRRYWDALETMMAHGPEHQHEDEIIKSIYPIEKVRALARHIERAETLAPSGIIAQRVQVIRYSYDNLMLYLSMREAEDDAKFARAAELAQKMLALHRQVDELHTVLYKFGDLDRVTEEAGHLTKGWIRQNKARAAMIDGTEGQLVAMLPVTWAFRTDPHDEGVTRRWFAPDADVADWRQIKVTRIWEVQGLEDKLGHGYDGIGWYRIKADVPARFGNRRIMLNFGGVHGEMIVWVNGRFVEHRPYRDPWWTHPYNANFDIDVTGVIEPGRDNTIVIRVDNDFEWGGLYRRVFLWAPN